MKSNFDPTQETHEEYLRRMYAKDKLTMEWKKNGQEKEAENIKRVVIPFRKRCGEGFRRF